MLELPQHQTKFIKILPSKEQDEMKRVFAKAATGEERWAAYSKVLDRLQTEKKVKSVALLSF